MKTKFFYGLLIIGLVFSVSGCGKQDPKAKKQLRHKERPTLESALKQKFNIVPGWDADKKRFVAISEVKGNPKNQSNYSITLLHSGQISRPDFPAELQGAVAALGEFAAFIQMKITDNNGTSASHSTVSFGQLTVKAETTSNEKARKYTNRIVISRGKENLFFLHDTGEKVSFQHTLAAQDINLFKSLLASNGLEYALIGWSEEDGEIRIAYSFKQLDTWKEKVSTATAAQLEYKKKAVRSKVKTGMKKISKKLDEWSEEKPE